VILTHLILSIDSLSWINVSDRHSEWYMLCKYKVKYVVMEGCSVSLNLMNASARNISHAYYVNSRLAPVPVILRFQFIDNDHDVNYNGNDMTEVVQDGEASSSTGSHRMRITSGGQVAGYVNFALTFLKVCPAQLWNQLTDQENPGRSLVLHTLPPANSESVNSQSSSSSLSSALLATPKLVSVAEKIKREYMVYINTKDVGKGKNKAVGIWQYNESGTLSQGQEEQELGLESILEGRTK